MWNSQEVLIDNKKSQANVKCGDGFIQVECRYDKKIMSAKTVSIGKDKYDVVQAHNVGERDETILITLWSKNNERKSIQSREDNNISD